MHPDIALSLQVYPPAGQALHPWVLLLLLFQILVPWHPVMLPLEQLALLGQPTQFFVVES
jgi:hypothetical protein